MKGRCWMAVLLAAAPAAGQKFYADDPLAREPRPRDASHAIRRKVSDYYDFVQQTFATPGQRHPADSFIRAQGVDTLGEPMEGAWYTRRHYHRPMTIADLVRGPGNDSPPAAGKWKVVRAKSEGVTPGFEILDSAGRRYVLKFDPIDYPEIATASDVLVSKFFYALGYHVPQNYIVTFREDKLELEENVEFVDPRGRTRRMTGRDLIELLDKVARRADGSLRASASLYLAGKPLGPFRYHGVRKDDPNDTVPHEHRRELRGLRVFCAWLGHDDSRSINTQDMLVEEDGVAYVRRHLIDFGSTLGSASYGPNSPRSGFEYVFEWKPAIRQFFSLGFSIPWWARARYPDIPSVGVFESAVFDPGRWVPEYPNPAFLNMLPSDAFWAAKQVMAFTDEQIGALAATGQYSDPEATRYITRCLIERRDKIGKAFFRRVVPLDKFDVRGGVLTFEDLGVKHGFDRNRSLSVQWSKFDNAAIQAAAISGATGFALPLEALPSGGADSYWVAEIHAGEPDRSISVYVRTRAGRHQVVGIERTWKN